MTGRERLPDKAFRLDKPLRDGIHGEEEALEGHSAEQRLSAGSDEAGRGDLTSVDRDADFGDGPDLASTTSNLNRLGTQRGELELIGQCAWSNEQRRTGVDQQVNAHRSARGTGETRGNVEGFHIAAILRPLGDQASVGFQIRSS